VALNTPPVTGRALELVRECRALGEVYEAALDRLLAALRRERGADAGETARAENLKTQLHRGAKGGYGRSCSLLLRPRHLVRVLGGAQ
jgi:hypothetical protein